jgi:hypothetical protein
MASDDSKIIDTQREAIAMLERENAGLRSDLRLAGAYARREFWAWQGDDSDHPESFGNDMAIMMTGSQVRALLAERDEADRRAGAAERRCADLSDAAIKRASWLRKAKAQAGYSDRTSFDVVWSETLAKASSKVAPQRPGDSNG